MNKVLEIFQKHYLKALVFLVVVVIAYLIYSWWKKREENTYKVVDDSGNVVDASGSQIQEATALADRLRADLESGWFWGNNFFGNVGRDLDAYTQLANASDTQFTLTCKAYHDKYKSSLIADIRAESSLGGTDVDNILAVAGRLKLS